MTDWSGHGQGVPDDFARPGQQPPSFPPPAQDAQPFSFGTPQKPVPRYEPGQPPAAGQPYAPGQPYTPGQEYERTAVMPPAPMSSDGSGGLPPFYGSGQPAAPGPVPPRRGTASRVAFGIGAIAALAVLAVSTLLQPGSTSVLVPAGGTRPAASAPAQGGTGGSASGGSSGTTTGSSTSSNATAAQSAGVVLITTTLTNGSAAGTGMIVDSSGLVLTNYHVVQGSTAIEVQVVDGGQTYTASVVGRDATNDVALLRLQGASGLSTVRVDGDAVKAGDTVTAVGNAQGKGYLTAAAGRITSVNATVTVSNDSGGTETLKDVYETDAAAQPGDSGGPLYDGQGEVTGMTTAGEQTYAGPHGSRGRTQQPSTVASYAIPIARAMSIVTQIESGTASGSVQIGAKAYLGISVASGSGGSVVVSAVNDGTPAAEAGITAGSTITSIAGTQVASQSDIAGVLGGHKPGETVKVTWTDASGDDHSASLTLGSSPVN